MSVEIQPIEAVGAELTNEKIKVTDYGVEVLSSLTPQEWCESVQTIGKYHSKAQFYLGDLVVYAEGINNTWGEKYDELVELTGYDYGSLRNYATICRKFPISFREEVLSPRGDKFISYGHFREVSSLDLEVAKYFLQTAGEAGWSTRRLAQEVANYKERKSEEGVVGTEIDDEGKYVPTFSQATRDMINWAKNFAKENDAQMIRTQIIKNGVVIEERVLEVY